MYSDEDEDDDGADEEVDDEDVIYQPEFDDGKSPWKILTVVED